MKAPPIVLLALITSAAFAAEKADITLRSGDTLKAARIVSLGKTQAGVVHAGGMTMVDIELLPPDVLVTARLEIAARPDERAKQTEEIAKRDAVVAEQKRRATLALAQASWEAKQAKGSAGAGASGAAPANIAESAILALKAQMPEKGAGHTSGAFGKGIEYDVPPVDVWSWYAGMFKTTTIQALPRTLAMVEARMADDRKRLEPVALRGSGNAARKQAEETLAWMKGPLASYIAEWRQLLAPPR